MKLVCIGDSLTTGYSISKNNCWVSLLNAYGFNCINRGVNGDTSIGILSRFFSHVLLNEPQKCIIMCGTNDLLMNKSIDTVIDNIKLMIKDCLSKNISPVILSPPKILSKLAIELWSNDINYTLVNSNLAILNEKLTILCKENNLLFLSIFNLIPNENKYYTDGIHLSYESNKIIFSEIKNRLA